MTVVDRILGRFAAWGDSFMMASKGKTSANERSEGRVFRVCNLEYRPFGCGLADLAGTIPNGPGCGRKRHFLLFPWGKWQLTVCWYARFAGGETEIDTALCLRQACRGGLPPY